MVDANVSRLGQNNLSGDERDLFLEIFTGEVMTAFEENNKMLNKTRVRTITEGKSAKFALVGGIDANYHTPGEELQGQNVAHTEQTITIDDLLVADAFIADIDEAMNHYDVRQPYSNEMGRVLARTMDENILNEVIKSARSDAVITDGSREGGSQIIDTALDSSTFADKRDALAQAIFDSAQIFDEKDVPESERYVAFKPSEYYVLAQNLDMINKDYGGQGAVAEGNIVKIGGIQVVKHNNVPKQKDTSSDTYHGVDASATIGVAWTPEAAGTVKLMDLSMRADYDPRRLGTLMTAKYAVGHGKLRPECAIELATSDVTAA